MSELIVDRHWLLTSTTYGTWLPGDPRGFVSNVADGPGPYVRHNIPGTPYDKDMRGLVRVARENLKCPPIYFKLGHAEVIFERFTETARIRRWLLCAVGIMCNHVHIVVGVPGDPDPDDLLRDFKSYASGGLNKRWKKPASDTWWTTSGSKRKLPDDNAVIAGVEYVKNQPNPLLIWINPLFDKRS
jgi:REP element-mobilizing transposase RayT